MKKLLAIALIATISLMGLVGCSTDTLKDTAEELYKKNLERKYNLAPISEDVRLANVDKNIFYANELKEVTDNAKQLQENLIEKSKTDVFEKDALEGVYYYYGVMQEDSGKSVRYREDAYGKVKLVCFTKDYMYFLQVDEDKNVVHSLSGSSILDSRNTKHLLKQGNYHFLNLIGKSAKTIEAVNTFDIAVNEMELEERFINVGVINDTRVLIPFYDIESHSPLIQYMVKVGNIDEALKDPMAMARKGEELGAKLLGER